MKNGRCRNCGSNDIQKVAKHCGERDVRNLSTFSAVKLEEYICCNCGLVETFLANMNDVAKIKSKTAKVEGPSNSEGG